MNKKLRFIFLGATKYSKVLLLSLIKNGFIPQAIFSIPEMFSISYSDQKVTNYNYADLKKIAEKNGINFFLINHENGQTINFYYEEISKMKLDLILALGWYYMIPSSIRELTTYGSWGIHASLLPKYAGGAPLTWAIINGETETGVTLFRMADGIDNGDIIAQKSFPINFNDTIKEVYEKATVISKNILIKVLSNIDKISFTPQDQESIKVYPQRIPSDGEINLNWDSLTIYNFIRAQSSPYPGAFIVTKDGKKLIIEKARLE